MKRIILLAFALSLVSCQELMDEHWRDKAEENYVNPFQGSYSGSFSGNLNGSLVLNVSKSGNTNIKKTYAGVTENFSAFVTHDGAFQEGMGSQQDFKLYGNLQTKSGTWKQGSLTGTWSVTKQ